MRIVHLAAGSLSSGAAKGSFLLHQAQRDIGLDSSLIMPGACFNQSNSIYSSYRNDSGFLSRKVFSRLGKLPLLFYYKRKPWLFSTGFSGSDVFKMPAYKQADIVHLHWINEFVSLSMIRAIAKPVVWTIRDMWPFTGGCHYSMECSRFKYMCGSCPQLLSNFSCDLSRLVFLRKSSSYSSNISFVAISNWLAEQASLSPLTAKSSVRTIHNSINTTNFSPVSSEFARKALGCPKGKKIILFGALNVLDFYKGFDLFVDSLNYLDSSNICIYTFGKKPPVSAFSTDIPVYQLGFLSEETLRLAYVSADVFVAPSRMEAFGKTLAESLSCGTPVVCFDATGPKDIVEHKVTGYKANPFDPYDLARGISYILSLSKLEYCSMSANSRDRALRLFSPKYIAHQYLDLYNSLI